MIRLLILVGAVSPICSRPGFRSSVMHGKKPILRMGPEEAQNLEGSKELKEPEWVTNLRNNIQKQIGETGFDDAKPRIKNLIEEANQAINGNNDEQRYPGEPLRSGPYKGPTSSLSWERDLKMYIKELIATYGRTNLDSYVRPVVNSIERDNQIVIQDIDGDITVSYVRNNENPNFPVPPPLPLKSQMAPRFTVAPDYRRE